jgi:nucleoid DNA-binding protein/cell division septation protein DedD
MTGEILRNLLDSRQRLSIPGLGLFTTETRSSEIQFGSASILPPSVRIEFTQRRQESSTELLDHLVTQYALPPSRAEELIENFVSEIRKTLAGNQRYSIPAFGTLASDLEGNIQFLPAEDQLFCLSSFGLKPVSARALAMKDRISVAEHEAPVIPLRPFEEKAGTKKRASFMAYAAVGAGLAMAAGSLIWLSTLGGDGGQQASVLPLNSSVKSESTSENKPLSKASPEVISYPSSAVAEKANSLSEAAPEAGMRFFVVAGSFRNPAIAGEAEKSWKQAGFETSFHSLEEKQMSRVAIGEFSSKEEALSFIGKSQPEFSSQLWILKESPKTN